MIRALYDWTISLARSPWALWALAAVAFIESSVFPIPPDVLMIPMIIAAPHRAFVIAGVATLASVLGGVLGYGIGFGLYETLGRPVLEFYGKTDSWDTLQGRFEEDPALVFWTIAFAGVTPFPYKVITIFAGAAAMNLPLFIATSILARGLRFFIVATLLWKYGAPIRDFIERRLGLMFTLFFILLIGGFAAIRYL